MWAYREGVAMADRDLVGYDVEATDGHIGKIDEASNEAGRSHLVVDTGFWIFGKKRLIPAGVVRRIDDDEEKVHIGAHQGRGQVRSRLRRAAADYRDEYDTYYEPFGR